MIVTLVSVDFGRISASARGCLKSKAKLRYAAEPFNFGEYLLSGRNDKYVITECNQIESFSAITADIERYYAGFAILDSLEKLSQEADARIFAHALKSLSELAYGDEKSAHLITTEFLKGVLDFNGASLDFGHCNVCKCVLDYDAYFSDKDGVVCKHCKSFDDIAVPSVHRAYLNGETPLAPYAVGGQANILLANLLNRMLGVKINTRYFTELL
ncbi:MAG: DNA repair protein RecO [Bacteroides sp.]|nr:DNA repair protein RecO [Bacillota bacterium]MCM1393647.1 DNA repair protein RecO [[Eubacterium] siraeum]MCM1455599.1 DNA repair protein RecO [Bacteroides sp.]